MGREGLTSLRPNSFLRVCSPLSSAGKPLAKSVSSFCSSPAKPPSSLRAFAVSAAWSRREIERKPRAKKKCGQEAQRSKTKNEGKLSVKERTEGGQGKS